MRCVSGAWGLEFHYTPKHGSWLNLAEIKIGVTVRRCLARRIPDREQFCRDPGFQTGEAQSQKRMRRMAVQDRLKLPYP